MIELSGGPGGLNARLDPRKGAAIVSLRLHDGRELLWQITEKLRSRFEDVSPSLPKSEGVRSQIGWMDGSLGGWEVMAPNAGDFGVVDGVDYPFHGTAGRSSWAVEQTKRSEAQVFVDLPEHALTARRHIRLDGSRCSVTESLANIGDTDRVVAWGSHLAFGGQLLVGELELKFDGELLGGSANGSPADIESLKASLRKPVEGQRILAYLEASGSTGWAQLLNKDQALTATVEWDALTFPYLWIWIELGGTQDWPWFGSARALGLEPASSWPAVGVERLPGNTGTQVVLEPRMELRGKVEVTFSSTDDDVGDCGRIR